MRCGQDPACLNHRAAAHHPIGRRDRAAHTRQTLGTPQQSLPRSLPWTQRPAVNDPAQLVAHCVGVNLASERHSAGGTLVGKFLALFWREPFVGINRLARLKFGDEVGACHHQRRVRRLGKALLEFRAFNRAACLAEHRVQDVGALLILRDAPPHLKIACECCAGGHLARFAAALQIARRVSCLCRLRAGTLAQRGIRGIAAGSRNPTVAGKRKKFTRRFIMGIDRGTVIKDFARFGAGACVTLAAGLGERWQGSVGVGQLAIPIGKRTGAVIQDKGVVSVQHHAIARKRLVAQPDAILRCAS